MGGVVAQLLPHFCLLLWPGLNKMPRSANVPDGLVEIFFYRNCMEYSDEAINLFSLPHWLKSGFFLSRIMQCSKIVTFKDEYYLFTVMLLLNVSIVGHVRGKVSWRCIVRRYNEILRCESRDVQNPESSFSFEAKYYYVAISY